MRPVTYDGRKKPTYIPCALCGKAAINHPLCAQSLTHLHALHVLAQTSPAGASEHHKRRREEDHSSGAAQLSHAERCSLPGGGRQKRCEGCKFGVDEINRHFNCGWNAEDKKKHHNRASKGCAGCGNLPVCDECWEHWDHSTRRCTAERDFRGQCGVSATI